MKNFEWSTVFEIGVPEIDHDHQSMVSITNEVREALSAARYEQASRLVDRLLEASKAHFRREESLLSQLGFSRLSGHVRYHAGLLEKAQKVRQVCEDAAGKAAIQDCYDEMLSFLVDDIVRGDYDFKSFLEERGLAKPRSKLHLNSRPG